MLPTDAVACDAQVDVARLPTCDMHISRAWHDTENVCCGRCRRHVLLQAPHNLGLVDLFASRVAALPPHPHRRLTAASLLACPLACHDAVREPSTGSSPSTSPGEGCAEWCDGVVVAAGDTDGVLTVTHYAFPSSPTASPSGSCSSLVVGQEDVWGTLATSAGIDAIVPCDDAVPQHAVVCHREREGPTVWVCSLDKERAWPAALPGPISAEPTDAGSGAVRLFDLAQRRPCVCAGQSPLSFVFGAANGSCASVHHASTLSPVAVFPLPRHSRGRWTVSQFVAMAHEHLYGVVLRDEEEAKGAVACFDARKPKEPYYWLPAGERGGREEEEERESDTGVEGAKRRAEVKFKTEALNEEAAEAPATGRRDAASSHLVLPTGTDGERQQRGGASLSPPLLMEALGTGDGAACALRQAAIGAPRLQMISWRTTLNGFTPRHELAFPSASRQGPMVGCVRAMAFGEDGVLRLLRV